MILSDSAIKKYLKENLISVIPAIPDVDIRPTGIRLHLNNEILIPVENIIVDLNNQTENMYTSVDLVNSPFILKPKEFILAASIEKVKTNNKLVCFIDGRSTIARLGLFVHCSSTTFDNIHEEHRSIVFEIYNCGKFHIKLEYKTPIGLLSFIKLVSPISQKSQQQYKNQESVLMPNLKFNR